MSDAYAGLTDATWNEKLAATILVIGIVAIGVAPFLINQLIGSSTENIMQQVGKAITQN